MPINPEDMVVDAEGPDALLTDIPQDTEGTKPPKRPPGAFVAPPPFPTGRNAQAPVVLPPTEAEDTRSNSDIAMDVVVDSVLLPARAASGVVTDLWNITGGWVPGWDIEEPLLGEAKTGPTRFITGAAQFALGFAASGGMLSALGIAAKTGVAASKANTIIHGVLKGATTDLLFVETHANLAALAEEKLGWDNEFIQLMSTDEDDSRLEKRLKGMAEGALMGGALDAAIVGIKGARKRFARRGDPEFATLSHLIADEASSGIHEALDKAQTIIPDTAFADAVGVNPSGAAAAVDVVNPSGAAAAVDGVIDYRKLPPLLSPADHTAAELAGIDIDGFRKFVHTGEWDDYRAFVGDRITAPIDIPNKPLGDYTGTPSDIKGWTPSVERSIDSLDEAVAKSGVGAVDRNGNQVTHGYILQSSADTAVFRGSDRNALAEWVAANGREADDVISVRWDAQTKEPVFSVGKLALDKGDVLRKSTSSDATSILDLSASTQINLKGVDGKVHPWVTEFLTTGKSPSGKIAKAVQAFDTARMDRESVPGMDKALRVNPRALSPMERLELLMEYSDQNLAHSRGKFGNASTIRAMEALYGEAINATRLTHPNKFADLVKDGLTNGVATLVKAHGYTGMDRVRFAASLLSGIRSDANATAAITRRVITYRSLMVGSFNNLMGKLRGVTDWDSLSDDQLRGIAEEFEATGVLIRETKAVISQQGVALASNRIKVRGKGKGLSSLSPDGGRPPEAPVGRPEVEQPITPSGVSGSAPVPGTSAEYLNSRGGRNVVTSALRLQKDRMVEHGIDGFARLPERLEGSKLWNMFIEGFIANMLSAPVTGVVNATGGILTTMAVHTEAIAGSTISALLLKEGGWRALKMSVRQSQLYLGTALDTLNLMRRSGPGTAIRSAFVEAVKTGTGPLTRKSMLEGGAIQPAITSKNLREVSMLGPMLKSVIGDIGAKTTATGHVFDAVGTTVRFPIRFLQGVDEIVKQIEFRSHTRARFLDTGEQNGLKGADLDTFVKEQVDKSMLNGSAYTAKLAEEHAFAKVMSANPNLLNTHPEKFNDLVQKELTDTYSPTMEATVRLGANRAEQVTHTEAADNTVLGHSMTLAHGAVRAVPALKLIMPFITVPVNIGRFASRRAGADAAVGLVGHFKGKLDSVPTSAAKRAQIAASNRLMGDLHSGDPLLRAEAIGRVAVASAVTSIAVVLAANAYDPDAPVAITGNGPKDPNERRMLMKTGHWAPYSVVINGKVAFSYNRLDPLSTIIGTIADAVDFTHWEDDSAEVSVGEVLIGSALVSFSNNFTNKTYLKGLSNLFSVLGDGDPDKARRAYQSLVASIVVPSVVNKLSDMENDDVRETRSAADALMARTPWGYDKLPTKRDALGNPVQLVPTWGDDMYGRWLRLWQPIRTGPSEGDPVADELSRLDRSWRPPGNNIAFNGVTVDLFDPKFKSSDGALAYDRYQELVGEWRSPKAQRMGHGPGALTVPAGKSLRDTLAVLFKTKEYNALPSLLGDDTLKDPRIGVITTRISAVRDAAKMKLFAENPAIQAAVNAGTAKKRKK